MQIFYYQMSRQGHCPQQMVFLLMAYCVKQCFTAKLKLSLATKNLFVNFTNIRRKWSAKLSKCITNRIVWFN